MPPDILTALLLYLLTFLIFLHFHRHITPHLTLAAEALGVIDHAHVFLAIIAGAEVFHALFYFAHAGGAEAVASTGMFHINRVIQRDFKDCVAFWGFNLCNLAVLHDKRDLWHWRYGRGVRSIHPVCVLASKCRVCLLF